MNEPQDLTVWFHDIAPKIPHARNSQVEVATQEFVKIRPVSIVKFSRAVAEVLHELDLESVSAADYIKSIACAHLKHSVIKLLNGNVDVESVRLHTPNILWGDNTDNE